MKTTSFRLVFVRIFATALLAVVPLAVSGQSKKDREKAKNLFEQGTKAFAQKNYAEAADKYGQAVVLVPNNAPAHFWKGNAHYYLWQASLKRIAELEVAKQKDNDPKVRENLTLDIQEATKASELSANTAISELTFALNQGFRPVQVYTVRAFIYYDRKNYDLAIADINKGLALAPKEPQFLKGLGEVYLAKGDNVQAIAALKNAAQVLPNDADVHYNLARAYFATGDVKAQLAEADMALKMGTRLPGDAYFLLGDANKKLNNTAAAIDAYQKAINSKPDLYQAYRDLSDIFRSENRFADAIKVSKAGVLRFPSDGSLWTDLSWFYSLSDRPQDAVEAAMAAVRYEPTLARGYAKLCRAYNDLKNYGEAVTACSTALRLDPEHGEANYYLGNAFVGQGKSTEATAKYGKAAKSLAGAVVRHSDSSDAWYLLGNAYFADNQREKSIEAYMRSLELSPKFARARYNLGRIHVLKKNKTAASAQYSSLLPLDAKLAESLKAEIDKM